MVLIPSKLALRRQRQVLADEKALSLRKESPLILRGLFSCFSGGFEIGFNRGLLV